MNPADAQRLGIADKQLVWVSSRRGKVISAPTSAIASIRGGLYDLSVVGGRLQ